jgi:hypothetical protein
MQRTRFMEFNTLYDLATMQKKKGSQTWYVRTFELTKATMPQK